MKNLIVKGLLLAFSFIFLLTASLSEAQTLEPIFNPSMTPIAFGPTDSPSNEGVDNVIDGSKLNKFLNFERSWGTSFYVNTGKLSIVKSVTITTGNDFKDRDPKKVKIYGRVVPEGITPTDNNPKWEEIDDISFSCRDLGEDRFTDSSDDVNNDTAYNSYWVRLYNACGGNDANSVQISEVQLHGTFNQAPSVVFDEAAIGSAEVGKEVKAVYDYSDPEEDTESGTTFQWFANDVAIADAISVSYTPTIDQLGKELKVEITPNDGTSFGASVIGLIGTVSCADGFTCETQNVSVCDADTYQVPNGPMVNENGSYETTSGTIKTYYNVTFDRAEVESDVFVDATIAESGTVTYQANTNATGALSFDKTQDYWVNMNALQDDLDGTSRSVFMWVKSEANVANDNQVLFAVNTSSGGNVTLFWIDNEGDNLEIFDSQDAQSASFNMSDQQWHYVGYTYDATTHETIIYVDGIENDRFTDNQLTVANSQYSLGQEFDNASDSDHFNGDMAEISVWDEVLTGAEVREAMKAKINSGHPKYANLVGYYSVFGDCNDDTAVLKDHSGKGNDGVMVNDFTVDFQNVQSIPGFNAIDWYEHISWKKDGAEVSTDRTYTFDVAAGSYELIATRNFVQSTDSWTMALNSNSTTPDDLLDETLCENDPIARTVTNVNAVNYLDFEESEENYVQLNSLSKNVAGKSRSIFMWYNKESGVANGDFDELLVFQDSDVDNLSRFYIRDTERLALWDGTNDRLNSSVLSNDTWYFVGYTYDNATGETKLYLNGNVEDSGTLNMPLGDGWIATLGAKYNDNGLEDYLDGKMAEITIWDKVLTQEEVTSLMGAASAHDATNLVAAYGTHKNIADNLLRDLTDNDNNGLASHSSIFVTNQEAEITNYDASANYSFSWKKDGAEFDTDASGNITVEEGTLQYSVIYGTPLFQKSDDFSLSYTNLLPTQPISETAGALGSVTFEVEEIAGASYQWYEKKDQQELNNLSEGAFGTNAYAQPSIVKVEGNNIYVATSQNGLFISSDQGNTWSSVNEGGNGIASNVIRDIYAKGDTILVFTGYSLDVSFDAGQSWSRKLTKEASSYFVDNNTIYITSVSPAVYKTTDFGETLTTQISSIQIGNSTTNGAKSYFRNDQYEFAIVNGHLARKLITGSTWTQISYLDNKTIRYNIIGDENYIFYSANGAKQLVRSGDNGNSWEVVFDIEGIAGAIYIDNIKLMDGVLYTNDGDGRIYKSTDYGSNWEIYLDNNDVAGDILDFQFDNEGNLFLSGATTRELYLLSEDVKLSDSETGGQIQGATTHRLTINNLSLNENSAKYFVEVTKDGCTQASDDVTLTVLDVPAVLSQSPSNESTDVAIDTELSIEFSRPVSKGTGELKIYDYATDALVQTLTANDLTIDGTTVSIASGVSLEYATQYYITLDADLTLDAGNAGNLALTDKDIWSFHTVCEPLVLSQPEDQSGLVSGSVTFSVPEVAGASYQWFEKKDRTEELNEFTGLTITDVYVTDTRIHVITGQEELHTSIDGGNTFTANPNIPKPMHVIENEGVIYVATSQTGLYISTDGGATFSNKNKANNGLASDALHRVHVHNGVIYASTNAGLSISTDNGESFVTRTVSDGLGSNSVYDVHVDGNTIYAATSTGGLSISTDGGQSFVSRGASDGLTTAISELVVAPDGTIYVGGNSVFLSKDGGSSFSELPTANQFVTVIVRDLEIEGSTVYINVRSTTTGAGIYSTADRGETLTTISQLGLGGYNERSMHVLNGQVYAGGLGGTLVRHSTTKPAADATDVQADNYVSGSTSASLTIGNLTSDLDQPEYFVVVTKGECEETSETVALSIVEGISIASVSPENNATDVAIDTDLSITYDLAFTKGTGSLRIKDYATDAEVAAFPVANATIADKTLTFTGISLEKSTRYYITLDEGLVVDGANNNSMALTDKDEWTFHTICEDLVLDQPEAQSAFAGGSITFSVPEVAGASYQWFKKEHNYSAIDAANIGFDNGIVFSGYADGDNYYMIGYNRKAFYTSDGGATWTDISTNKSGSSIYVDGDQIYQSGTDGVALSYDGGATFKEINVNENGFSGSPGGIWEVIYGIRDEVYVYKGVLYVSTDRGENFVTKTIVADGVEAGAVQIRSYDGTLYVASNQGLYISTDKGDTFTRKTTANGLSSDYVRNIIKHNNLLFLVSTSGTGASAVDRIELSYDNGESFTSLSESTLGSTDIRNVSIGPDGKLYIATPEGLKISNSEGSYDLISTANGLSSNDVKDVKVGSDGKIYAVTSKRLTVIENAVGVEDSSNLTVQNAISGATTASLTIGNLTEDLDQTEYFVVVSKGDCEETTDVAILTVGPADALAVVSSFPAFDATDVAVDLNQNALGQAFSITFNHPMRTHYGDWIISANGTSVGGVSLGGGIKAKFAEFSNGDKTLNFIIKGGNSEEALELQPNTTYEISGFGGLASKLTGEKYFPDSDAKWSFTTQGEIVDPENPFILKVQTTGSNEEFTIPVKTDLTYNYHIDWGDGTEQNNQTGTISHTYANAGTYEVKIGGTFPAINFGQVGTGASEEEFIPNAEKVKDILSWGDVVWSTMNNAFAYTGLGALSATDQPDLSQVTDMSNMFYRAELFNGDLSGWNVGNVTNMEGLFDRAEAFNGNIATWNVSNVTNMNLLFNAADAFNGDLSNWNTANVTTMVELFDGAESFNGDISGWDVSKVTTMSEMFSDATAFNGDLSSWDVSSVTNMYGMFEEAISFNGDISGWNVGNVTTTEEMFLDATAFNQNLQNWDVSKVISMDAMFKGATAFNGNLSGWRMSSATAMDGVFQDAEAFNQDISAWDVSSATIMSDMFSGALAFNQDISSWNVAMVEEMDEMFSGAESFNQDISAWNVSNVTNMEAMFIDAAKFDQDLSGWDIRKAAQENGLQNLFDESGLTMANYDATLIGWSALNSLASGVSLGSVPTTFCQSQEQRQMLIDNLGWTFDDQGKANNCFVAPDAVTLDSFVPTNGATDVAISANITLTYSENVQAYVYGEGGDAANNVVLYDANDNIVETFAANTLSFSGSKVTINPTSDLAYNTAYYVLIDNEAFISNNGVKTAAVTDPTTISFTTAGQPNTAPVAANVAFTGNLEANQQLTGNYDYSDVDTDAESGSTLQWFVADDATGANRTAISGATSGTFTLTSAQVGKYITFGVTPNDGTDEGTQTLATYTGPVVAAVVPEVISTNPSDGTIDVAKDANLSFTMSETVTKGTGNITLTPVTGTATVIDVTSNQVAVSGADVTINPDSDLLEGQFYTVTFDASAFVDADGNNSVGLTSQTTWNFTVKETNVAPVAQGVTIKKSLVVDGVLGGSYTYSDANDDPESGTTFQWYRADNSAGANRVAIAGATTKSYTVVNDDNGKYVSFEVTPSDGILTGTAEESTFFGPIIINDGITNIPPAFTSDALTSILDNETYSYTVTFEDLNNDVPTLTKTTGPDWLNVNGLILSGNPTSANVGDHDLVLTLDDQNGGTITQEFTVTVLASNTAPIVKGLEVNGTTTIDETLTATYNFIDAEQDADNSAYKWYRADDNSGTGKTEIAGATTTTYVLKAADAGKYISFEVTPNDGKVSGTDVESVAVGSIAKKTPSLSLSDIAKTYGDANFNLAATTNSSGTVTYAFNNDQTGAAISGSTVTLANVGEIVVNVNLAEDAEYTARQVQGTITVAKKAIALKATDAGKLVDDTDPTLEFAVTSGSIVGDDEVVTASRDAGEAPGTYAINLTDGTDAANYEITAVPGVFTISQRSLTITAQAATKTYGDNDPTFNYSITEGALKNGEELSGGITRVEGEDVGTYALQGSLFNPNYDISFVSADLTIEKADLTATADDQTKYLGEANPELTISYSGFVNGDSKANISEPTIATTATESSSVGTYDVTLSGGAAANYNLNLVNGQLTVEQRPFVITVDAQYSISREIEVFGVIEGLTYDYTVDWGDGNIDTNLTEAANHTYTSAGPFTVKVTGNYPGLQLKYFNIKSIEQWGSQEWESLENALQNRDLTINATDAPDLSQGPSMAGMFRSTRIGSPDLTAWDVSLITNMSDIFNGSDFNGNVSNWNVSNVTDMSGAFGSTPFNGDISTWNVGNVTTMRSMFIQATDFNGDLSNWDVSSVTNMESVFNNADSFNGDISSWDVSSVTDMTGMFSEADLFNQDISSWDVSNVVDMASMFSGTKAFNQPLDAWDVSSVVTMEIMFRNADAFNQDLNSWDVSKVEKFDEMFKQTALFNGDITGWDVSSGQDFEEMFQETEAFNQPIGNWNLASATRVRRMFRDAEVFNQPINDWRFPKLESLEQMFWGALVFNQDLNDWDVSNITNMASTFEEAESFNGNISNWDVSNVEDFDEFMNETPFNQDISGWNVSNAKDFGRMFEDSPNFNQDLSNWDMSKATDVAYMFESATSFDQDISSWQLTSVTSFGSMLKNSGLSVEYYDAFLISISEQELITDVQFDVEGLQYCAGAAARQSLIDNFNWTIENDSQACSAMVTIADVSANEDDGAITVTLTSDAFVVGGFTVDVSTSNGTAEAGTDYTAVTSETITFAGTVGETQSFTITPTADSSVESDETLTVSMSNLVTDASNTVTITDEATITILNDDVPVVSFNTTAQSSAESVTSSSIVVNLDQAGLAASTVDYTVTGTATGGGVDYTLANGSLNFAAGELSKTIDLTIVDDALIEENETVVITLSNASGASLGTNTVYTYTIVNNDAQVTIEDVSQFEDGEPFLITATLEGTIEGGFTVDLSTADGTATVADGDYTAVSGTTLTFIGTDGEVQKLDIAPGVDSKLEADETFTVSLSNLSGTTANVVITDQAVLTIKNDDAAAVILADASGNEGDGAITVTATLDNAVQGGFSVEVNTADGTATLADSDYSALKGQVLTFAGTAGETQTFTVTPTNDLVIEANETLTVSMSNMSSSLAVNVSDEATVTIVNDDFNNAPTDITISASSIAENNALDAAIGTLTTTDADAGNTHTYALVSGAGDTDNASFILEGSTLKANNTSFNFEDKASYSVRIETNDGEGGTFGKSFEITVTNVNEAPFTLSLTNAIIDEADEAQEVGQLMSLDPDNGDTFTYSLVAGDGDADNAQFAISGNTLSTAGAIDFEDGASRSIRVQVADAGGLTFEQTFSITIEDVVAEPVREYTQNQPGADVKNVFSPNGDGVNETWVIEDLLDNPFNQVKIFAQGGKLIYSKVNYSNDWAGTFKDNPVPDGTYYYEILIYADAQSTTPARTIKGFLTIIRNR